MRHICLSFSVFIEFVVVVTYPVKFRHNIIHFTEVVRRWDFDWSYAFAWGGIIFSISSALFYCLSGRCVNMTIRTDAEVGETYE